jgi:GTP-binding protein YchF
MPASSGVAGRAAPQPARNPRMRISLIGLAASGKTTFYNLLTQRGQQGSLSGKKGSNIATVFVPDERLDYLTSVYHPKKTVHAAIEFLDTPGLSAEGEGKGFASGSLDEVRRADSFCLLIREFEDPSNPHPLDTVNGARDLDLILNEFVLNDLLLLEKRIEKLKKSIVLNKRHEEIIEQGILEQMQAHLEAERPLRDVELTEQDRKTLACYQLLTMKPLLIAINVGEGQVGELDAIIARYQAKYPKLAFTGLCATLESELAQMEPADAQVFMADLGLKEMALTRVLKAAFGLLHLQVFFTAGDDECRAWPMPINGTAFEAAGCIHTDFQRGFIRAMVLPYADFVANPTPETFKRQGVQRRKEELIADGDIVEFRFNVSK